MANRSFSATSRAAELVPSDVEIAGQQFKVKRTGRALKKIITLSPDTDANGNAEMDPSEGVTSLYAGISFVLVDTEGSHPDPEWLEDNLDFEVAQELMEKFVPRGDERPPDPDSQSIPALATQG